MIIRVASIPKKYYICVHRTVHALRITTLPVPIYTHIHNNTHVPLYWNTFKAP